jgi:DNA ligase-associated metallophosphoesterase
LLPACTNSGVELAPGRIAHASGALWLPDAKTVVVADVHLGFGWALRRRGQLGPVEDDATRAKLLALTAELRPETIVFLGDLVHAPRPAQAERDAITRTLQALEARLVVVLGNHDRGFTRDFSHLRADCCDEWHGPGLVAVHGDRELPQAEHVVCGHLHPALSVFDDAGSGRKMPAFVAGRRVTLLPAFSPFAAGFDVRAGLPFEMRGARVVVASGKRAVDVGLLSRLRAAPGASR